MVDGLKLTVVPDGIPLADSATWLLKLPCIAVVIVDEACVPCCVLTDAGFALTVRLALPAVTVSETVVLC